MLVLSDLTAVPGITQSNQIGKRWIIADWCTNTAAARWSAVIEITLDVSHLHTCVRELILLQELLDPPFLWIELCLRCFRPLKLKEQLHVLSVPLRNFFCFPGPGPLCKVHSVFLNLQGFGLGLEQTEQQCSYKTDSSPKLLKFSVRYT